jgi:hypothetical protein
MADKDEGVRIAIDVMTAWTTEQDGTEFTASRVAEYLGDPDGGRAFLNGMISLSGYLLVGLARAEGESGNATPEEMLAILQDIARRTLGA